MTGYQDNVQWSLSLAKKFHDENLTEIYDPKNDIKYQMMKPWDIQLAAEIMSQAYSQDNMFFKLMGVSKADYLPSALLSYKQAMEDNMGMVAKTRDGVLVGASGAYLVDTAIAEVKVNLEDYYGKKVAPIMDMSRILFQNFSVKDYDDPSRIIYIDDTCALSQYRGKGISLMLSLLLQSICQRRSFTHVCSIAYHPALARNVEHMPGWKKISSVNVNNYSYRNEKIFAPLYNQGYRDVTLFIKKFIPSKI
ncbi:hypothetical protein TrispH2_010278 [Trichoplax sp. H2]|nr:hypothetical protein TrispH2_010278 [Trichoplax sp. H2]|eukprot:RDD37333.1 hypothetical protein TrispH2_010278 [Trichoplax sp. H2]